MAISNINKTISLVVVVVARMVEWPNENYSDNAALLENSRVSLGHDTTSPHLYVISE